MILARLGIEMAHRLHLFWHVYDNTNGMNHVADGYFSAVYLAGISGAILGFAAARMLRLRYWRIAAGSVGLLNLALCAAFLIMHRTGALVTYDEFVTIWGP